MTPVLGSVIEGTLRLQDLIPKFLHVLQEHNPVLWVRWTTPKSPDYVDLPKDDNDKWWDSDEAQQVLIDLIEALDELAPPKSYFGAHFSNSSDYGFWTL